MENSNGKRNGAIVPTLKLGEFVHILSFLPFKESARLRRISKDFNNAWLSIRRIDLDETMFTKEDVQKSFIAGKMEALACGVKRTGREHFLIFARKFCTLYRGNKIDVFRLCLSNPGEFPLDVEVMVRFAVSKGVEDLELDLSDRETITQRDTEEVPSYPIPQCVYDLHNSLKTLKLSGCRMNPHWIVTFETLQSLTIAKVRMTKEMVEALVSQNANLREVNIIKCEGFDHVYLNNKSGKLRVLRMEGCMDMDIGLTINAVNLKTLIYSGPFLAITVGDHNLDDVVVEYGEEEEFIDHGDILALLLVQINGARVLTVGSFFTQVVPSGEEPLKLPCASHTVKHLILKEIALHRDELYGVAFLLRSFGFLNDLTIKLAEFKPLRDYEPPFLPSIEADLFWRRQIVAFQCLHRYLRNVVVEGFKGLECEMAFLKYLLRHAHVLNNLTIKVAKVGDEEIENSFMASAEKVATFPRASGAVRMFLGYDN